MNIHNNFASDIKFEPDFKEKYEKKFSVCHFLLL